MRYIRAAFPSAFDSRWRAMREWVALLREHAEWIQGIYLRLSTPKPTFARAGSQGSGSAWLVRGR